jgi:AraC-like DNA-binding protein
MAGVLRAHVLLDRDGISITDVACHHGAGPGAAVECAGAHRIVLVRRGCFVRRAAGEAVLHDPTTAYAVTPGDEERVDHPQDQGDDCTAIGLSAELAATLWSGEPLLPRTGLPIDARLDLEHRLLLAAGRRGDDPHEVVERAVTLAAGALATAAPERVAAGPDGGRTARAHRALADGVREALVEDPGRALPELARALAVSPHHLSRVFRAVTGETIAHHRLRLRTRAALERLDGGERDLARLAADTGFADQSHLHRVVRRETGQTPAALRRALAA